MAALACGALASGCASTATPAGPSSGAVTYLCDRAVTMSVAFSGGAAVLTVGGRSARLTQQPAGSGIHYVGEGHDLRGKGPEATWRDEAGVIRACRDQAWAMSQPQVQPPIVGLAGTAWRLVHFQSSDDSIGTVTPPRPERYILRFAADGALAAQLDCNRANGRWSAGPTSATGGALTLSGGAMTRAACGPGALDVQIARDLGNVRSYTLAGGRLNLALQADAGVYVWSPAPGDSR